MNSKNVNNYENVVIRKEQEIGINNFGLEYLVSLEQEIERLNKDLKDACEVIERLKEDKKKAIEYIEEKVPQSLCLPNGVYDMRGIDKNELLNILRGEANE